MMLDRRVDRRRKVLWVGKSHRDGCILECEIFDISAEGAKIRSIEHLTINATVVLEIDRLGMFPGEIRWQAADHTGISFLESASSIEVRLRGAAVPATDESRAQLGE